jgi:hypothetical protein
MSYNGRAAPRAEPGKDVYVFWSCDGPGILSRVRNLSLGGIFIETHIRKDLGTPVELYFIEPEGQIRAKAAVLHAEPGQGLGLKFTILDGQDRIRFGAVMKRLYAAPCSVSRV